MFKLKKVLERNARILRTPVNKYTYWSLVISLISIAIASIALSYQLTGNISISGIMLAHRSNVALWFLDITPFIYTFAGQVMGNMMAYKAGAMVLEQKSELNERANNLEKEIQYKLTYDSLTGIPNRSLFIDKINKLIPQYYLNNQQFAIVIFNINGFKEINDGFGELLANKILLQISRRLIFYTNESNHLSRIHGDEFCIFLPEIEREDDVAKFIDKIYKAMSIDFNIQNKSIQISLTAGVVLGPRENDDADVLLHHAGAAVSYARNLGQTFAFYESKLDEKSSNRLFMTRELKHAIQAEELIVLYQPKVFLETGQVAGAEALVRWSHHEFGIVPADTFVLLAEQTGLINSLTNYVLKKVLAQLRKWHDTGNRISVSINISILNVIDLDFPNSVELLLRKYKVSSKYIKFEIIESAYMNNEDRAVSVIKRLSDLCIKISIDDFGTGYSSFTYLINLPISEIKIDKSFVLSMLDDNKQASVVSAIVQLGRSLNLEVVAEGVEDSVIETKLAKMGCDYGQGFYYAAALNADEFIKFTPPRNLR